MALFRICFPRPFDMERKHQRYRVLPWDSLRSRGHLSYPHNRHHIYIDTLLHSHIRTDRAGEKPRSGDWITQDGKEKEFTS